MNHYPILDVPCSTEACAHAVRDYPRESIGLAVLIDGQNTYVPCENLHAKPEQDFALDSKVFAKWSKSGEILGLIHSHPDFPSTPSEADRVMCEASGSPWYVLAVHRVEGNPTVVDCSRIEPEGFVAPLIGRKFHHGVLDCFSLLKDYYREKLSIELPDFAREDEWWRKGQNLYMENYAKAGFVVSPGDLQEHDIIIMQIRSTVPNHAGIYTGNSRMIHHLCNQLSREEMYGGYFREATRLILRHRSLMK